MRTSYLGLSLDYLDPGYSTNGNLTIRSIMNANELLRPILSDSIRDQNFISMQIIRRLCNIKTNDKVLFYTTSKTSDNIIYSL